MLYIFGLIGSYILGAISILFIILGDNSDE